MTVSTPLLSDFFTTLPDLLFPPFPVTVLTTPEEEEEGVCILVDPLLALATGVPRFLPPVAEEEASVFTGVPPPRTVLDVITGGGAGDAAGVAGVLEGRRA